MPARKKMRYTKGIRVRAHIRTCPGGPNLPESRKLKRESGASSCSVPKRRKKKTTRRRKKR